MNMKAFQDAIHREVEVAHNRHYSMRDLDARLAELKLYAFPTNENKKDIALDYSRARMLISALLADKDASDKYIKRLETMNDKLIGLSNL